MSITVFMQGRVLAIDLGTKLVGLAISDELRVSTHTLSPLPRTNWKKLCLALLALCKDFDVKMVVLGLPLRLDGSEGDAAKEVRRIARNLSLSLRLPIEFQDERYTSKESESFLLKSGVHPEKLKKYVDSTSAMLILQDFLLK